MQGKELQCSTATLLQQMLHLVGFPIMSTCNISAHEGYDHTNTDNIQREVLTLNIVQSFIILVLIFFFFLG